MTYRLVVVTVENEILRALPSTLGDSVNVQIFESGNDALWELRMNPPEAVVAELDLPGMTGLELAEIIPNFEIATNVLLYSPSPNSEARAKAEALGVYQFLDGPGAEQALYPAIQAALHEARQAATAAAVEPEEEPEEEPEPTPVPEVKPRRVATRPVAPARPAARAASSDEPKPERREFTPARVVLPSAREREQAAAAAAAQQTTSIPPRGGLASRTKAAVDRKPEPKPKAEPKADPAPDLPGRRSSGTLVVTAENINAIRKTMSELAHELGAQSVMLTDRAGMVLVDVGTTDNLPMMIVLPLLSTSFSTTGEVARQLREEDPLSVYIHDGMNYALYCFDVLQRFLLVLVFNKKVASSPLGTVWISAKRAIRELRTSLSNA